ncbi:MAG TPA: hypothetical protein VEX18_16800 [Polyangiaceae bacterium]|nr:hypothetical protein [Polyangiaceae bacterium]
MPNKGVAYWLRGEEECQHCSQSYTFAVERRCTHCDGPSCPHCVTLVHATGEIICTRCTDEPGDDDESNQGTQRAESRPGAPKQES